jgi:lipid-binding SYLF domain-containing protein
MEKNMRLARHVCYGFLALSLAGGAPLASAASKDAFASDEKVQSAQATLDDFRADPGMDSFREQLKTAKAVIVAPSVTRAAAVVGGSGGKAVVLARTGEGDGWSEPAFYKVGAGSVGLQLGVDVSQVVMLVMSDKALNALLSGKFTLGPDAGVAIGGDGSGKASTVTADVVSYARAKGVFLGLSMEGAVITPDNKANEAYYGRPANAVDILVRGNAHSPKSAAIQQSLTALTR